uniref:Regulator of vps4 activity in the mvb pathway protein isoform 2 n=1 Tax=Tetraselmis sp. GSL018 TaxID=582737 RepID=A0A061RNH3_9CHLO
MFKPRFNCAKCKTASGLVTGRLKLLKNKKAIQIKHMKRDIAELLRQGRNDNAIIRTEAVIHQEKLIAAFDLLELFCDLLSVRLQLIERTKEIPSDMREAIASIIYAARRVPEVPEVLQLSQQLAHKYGKDFAASAAGEETCRLVQVNEKLIECLSVRPPTGQIKLDLLAEVAREFSVTNWDYELARRQLVPDSTVPPGMMTGPPPSQYVDYVGRGGRDRFDGDEGGGDRLASCPPAASGLPHPRETSSAVEQSSRRAASADGAHHPPAAEAPGPAVPWPPPPSTASLPEFSWAKTTKTDEEIQREYDAAQGPPEKPHADAKQEPPCAPPLPSDGAHAPTVNGASELPNPPSYQAAPLPEPPRQQPGGPPLPAPGQGPDELDELTKRFEALKGR